MQGKTFSEPSKRSSEGGGAAFALLQQPKIVLTWPDATNYKTWASSLHLQSIPVPLDDLDVSECIETHPSNNMDRPPRTGRTDTDGPENENQQLQVGLKTGSETDRLFNFIFVTLSSPSNLPTDRMMLRAE